MESLGIGLSHPNLFNCRKILGKEACMSVAGLEFGG